MTTARPPGRSPLTAHEALADATIVAIVVHGVGDHTPVDILNEAVEGAISLWGDAATTTRIEIEGLPVPRDINSFAFLTRETPEALQVLVGARKHIVLPIIWSGVRGRAGRSARGPGPQSLMTALPALFGICRDLFGCIPRAQGLWTAGVFLLASVLSLILGGFTCAVAYLVYKLPWWLGAPYYPHWYQIVLAVVSFTLIEFVVRRFSLVFDLLGDVS